MAGVHAALSDSKAWRLTEGGAPSLATVLTTAFCNMGEFRERYYATVGSVTYNCAGWGMLWGASFQFIQTAAFVIPRVFNDEVSPEEGLLNLVGHTLIGTFVGGAGAALGGFIRRSLHPKIDILATGLAIIVSGISTLLLQRIALEHLTT